MIYEGRLKELGLFKLIELPQGTEQEQTFKYMED